MVQSTPRQKETIFSDFLFNLNKNPNTDDLVRVTNEQAVINSIKKILKTNHYEIPYAPYFGANLQRFLFEPFLATTEMEMRNEIEFAIKNFEPRARILDIVINSQPNNNSIDITLTVSIINSPTPVTVTTTLIRIR